jgi:hypothetical protein
MNRALSGSERLCPICGQVFWAYPGHVYKHGGYVLCSWKCLRKFESGHKPDGKGRSVGAKASVIFDKLSSGMKVYEIACDMGLSNSTVCNYIRRYNMKSRLEEKENGRDDTAL